MAFCTCHALFSFPYVIKKENLWMAIEEIGTLCAISLLVFIRMNIRKEGVGIAIIYVLGGVIILPMLLKFAHMVVIIVQKYFRKHRV